MKTLGGCIASVSLIFIVVFISFCIYADFNYDKNIGSYWKLSVKASTIAQKSEYMDKFVLALDNAKLEGLNANLIFQTPDTDFDQNYKALISLQKRLTEIKTMDVDSFAYQTAIQQITAQEQGEATSMLSVFNNCWDRNNYALLWFLKI